MKLIDSLVDSKIETEGVVGLVERKTEYVRERRISRNRCAHCALFSIVQWTRFWCVGCNVPLCSMGMGHVGQDCFTLCHENETNLQNGGAEISRDEAKGKQMDKGFHNMIIYIVIDFCNMLFN